MMIEFNTESQASLGSRKIFALRTRLVRHFSGLDDSGLVDPELYAARNVRRMLADLWTERSIGIGPNSSSNDAIPLDVHLKGAPLRLVRREFEQAKADGHAWLAARLDALATDLNKVECTSCAGERPICRAQGDAPVVAAGGVCVDEIRMAFQCASELTSWLYDGWHLAPEDQAPITSRVRTVLKTVDTANPHGLECNIGIGGRVRFTNDAGGKRADVDILYSADDISSDAIAVLLYVMTHELVCHAFQSANIAAVPIIGSPYDSWAEGWMDCIAKDLVVEAIEGIIPVSIPPTVALLPNAIEAIERYHAARYADADTDPLQDARSQLRFTKAAYGHLCRRLRIVHGATARAWIIRLRVASARLTASGMAGTESARLIERAARSRHAQLRTDPTPSPDERAIMTWAIDVIRSKP